MSLEVECLSAPTAFAGLEREWTALEQRLAPRLPFRTWHWNEAWWRHFAVDSAALRDNLRLYTVRDRAGALLLLAPMVLTERPARGPLRARALHFFGADPNVTELRGPLCAPEHARDAFAALLSHLDARPAEWDWLEWGSVPWGSPGERALETRGALTWARETPDFLLPLGPSWEALKHSRGRNLKESLRKCYNSLKRDGLTPTLRVAESAEAVPAALSRFFELHRARARLDVTVGHADVFATLRTRAFLLDYATGGAARGEGKVFELLVDGKVVASRVGFVLGDALYLYFSGFDPAFGKYSVMTTATAEALQWAVGRGLAVANFSPGRDVSKTRWGPAELLFRDAVLASRRRRGAVMRRAFVSARAAQHAPDGLVAKVLRLGGRSSH